MKISYSIMAHPKRKEWAEKLSEELDCPIYWDTDNTIWNTCKGAWRLHEKDADYHCVIQDDAILSKNFKKDALSFVKRINEKIGKLAVNFYFGERPIEPPNRIEEAMQTGFLIRKLNAWGVSICLPTDWIEEMIKFGDGYPVWQDDTKIKYYLAHKGYRTAFALPSLVDHKRMAINPTLTPSLDSDRYSPYFIDGVQKNGIGEIPKIIHQIWIGDKTKMPKELMDTWKMEGWEYILWTEKEIDSLVMENRKLYDYFYNKKCYYGASDVVRLEVVKKYGGIYIDADTERLQPIDEILENCTFVSVFSNTASRVANGVIGAVPEHKIINEYIKSMGNATTVEPVWNTIGGTMFTEMIAKYQDKYTKLLPARSFYPFDSKGVRNTSRHKNYARHYWGSTHKSYGTELK